MNEQSEQWKSGIVIGVLAGDTVLVRGRTASDRGEFTIVGLSDVDCPSIEERNGSTRTDAIGKAARKFTEERLMNQQVMYGQPIISDSRIRNIVFTFYPEGVIGCMRRSLLLESDITYDIQSELLSEGLARVSSVSSGRNKAMYDNIESRAKIAGRGIWGIKGRSIESVTPTDLMGSVSVQGIVLSVHGNLGFDMMLDNGGIIKVSIAGLGQPPPEVHLESYGLDLGAFLLNFVLVKKANLRVLKVESNGLVIGRVKISGRDLGCALLERGYSYFDEISGQLLGRDGVREMKEAEKLGIINRCGALRDRHLGVVNKGIRVCKVGWIRSSKSFGGILEGGGKGEFEIDIWAPHFDFVSIGQKGGLEAWKYLRGEILNKLVRVTVTRMRGSTGVGRVEVEEDDVWVDLGEKMIRDGYASRTPLVYEPTDVNPSNRVEWEREQSLITQSQAGGLKGIVMEVLCPHQYVVFLPDIGGSLTISLKYVRGPSEGSLKWEQGYSVAKSTVLCRDVVVELGGFLHKSGFFSGRLECNGIDIGELMIREGFVRYQPPPTETVREAKIYDLAHESRKRLPEWGGGILIDESRKGKVEVFEGSSVRIGKRGEVFIIVKDHEREEDLWRQFERVKMIPTEAAIGSMVLVQRNQNIYRGFVRQSGEWGCRVRLIDSSQTILAQLRELTTCPDDVKVRDVSSQRVGLGYVVCKPGCEKALENYLRQLLDGTKVYIKYAYRQTRVFSLVWLGNRESGVTLQELLLKEGLVLLNNLVIPDFIRDSTLLSNRQTSRLVS